MSIKPPSSLRRPCPPIYQLFALCLFALGWLAAAPALAAAAPASRGNTYILGDSIAYGLALDGVAAKLAALTGGEVRISYDGARSITTAGNQIHKSALESVEIDRDFIAQAQFIVLILGMNPTEASFADSQRQLLDRLKRLAPRARYFWVDIGATIAPQAAIWSERNQLIYRNAAPLGYQVVSRYQAIFGPQADPLHITPGLNFPGWPTEPGYGGPGNIHGFDGELSQALVEALGAPAPVRSACARPRALNTYMLGDSVSDGLQREGLAARLQQQLGGRVHISADVGRSITEPGVTLRQSALESVALERDLIAQADVIVLVLGTNQSELSFADSQALLLHRLRQLAPQAAYFWVDIGATIATQAAGWSERNRILYANAAPLAYTVISRYKAIFGAGADPLQIVPGANFPGWLSEPGYGAPGNVHGMHAALAQAILDALPQPGLSLPAGGCGADGTIR